MSPTTHRIYISTLTAIVAVTFIVLSWKGLSYYSTPLEDRFYHPDHASFKPSGFLGHGLGIVGTLLILIGVFGYIAKKRYNFLPRFGRLKYWLEFHIFLCTLGPVMVLFHTAFKFGGIVSIAFWSMIAVVISGIIGRFIYIQIPRTIEGRELSLQEIQQSKLDIATILKNNYHLNEQALETIQKLASTTIKDKKGNLISSFINKFFEDRKNISAINKILRTHNLTHSDKRKILKLVKTEINLNNKIQRLQSMRQLFKYWHVAHLPFALIMLVILAIHVAITLAFGYKWIF